MQANKWISKRLFFRDLPSNGAIFSKSTPFVPTALSFGRQCDAGIERICRHYIRIASVHQDCTALGLAVNAYYLSFTVRAGQFGMEGLDKFLHPVCHSQVIDSVSTRHRVDSEGIPFLNILILRNLLML